MEIILNDFEKQNLRIELTKIALGSILAGRDRSLEIAASDNIAKKAIEIADATMIRLEIK